MSITGAFEVTPEIHGDMRGAFLEWFREDRFTKSVGQPLTPLLSAKDQQAPRLSEARGQEPFPSYEQTQSFAASLRD